MSPRQNQPGLRCFPGPPVEKKEKEKKTTKKTQTTISTIKIFTGKSLFSAAQPSNNCSLANYTAWWGRGYRRFYHCPTVFYASAVNLKVYCRFIHAFPLNKRHLVCSQQNLEPQLRANGAVRAKKVGGKGQSPGIIRDTCPIGRNQSGLKGRGFTSGLVLRPSMENTTQVSRTFLGWGAWQHGCATTQLDMVMSMQVWWFFFSRISGTWH